MPKPKTELLSVVLCNLQLKMCECFNVYVLTASVALE